METLVAAPTSGTVSHVAVIKGGKRRGGSCSCLPAAFWTLLSKATPRLWAARPLLINARRPSCPRPSHHLPADQCDTGDLLVLIKPGPPPEDGGAGAGAPQAELASASA